MGATLSQRIVDAMPFLDDLSGKVQPKVREAVSSGGETARYLLDGTWFGTPLHPALSDAPIGAWTATLAFDGVDAMRGSKAMKNAADASLAFGIAGGVAAAAVGMSDWRYLSGGSRRMGMAHALANTAGLTLNIASLALRASGRRNAGKLASLAGYSLVGMGAHLGGELSYGYGLRVNRGVYEPPGPDEFTPVLDESLLPEDGMRRVELDGLGILLSRADGGAVHAISATCNHFSGPLEEGERDGKTVVCPWHHSRFDLETGEALSGPATFPQSRYETRVRDGKIEVKADPENVQKKVR